jgi:outer membrane protein assembly factor BamE (lipoprotein component of BamABCDE complex)
LNGQSIAGSASEPSGPAHVAIQRAARYVNASRDARGRDQFRHDGNRPGTGEQFQKGYILPAGALEQIPMGASQDQVLIVMGTPSTVATLNGEVFYYISQRSERMVAFMNQKVVDQRVIAIYFDKNRQVQRLANYGLQDGKIFDFISRTTPTSGQELSYLTPLFKLLSF